MTERLPGRFFCNFLLGCSPLYPRAVTMSTSQVCAAIWFRSDAKLAGQCDSMWFFKQSALRLHITNSSLRVLRQSSFWSKVLSLLVTFTCICISLLEQQLALHKALASSTKLLSLQFLKYSGTFQRFQDYTILSVGNHGPKVNLIITKSVPSLKCEQGLPFLLFILFPHGWKKGKICINWNETLSVLFKPIRLFRSFKIEASKLFKNSISGCS